jgi:Alpha amylase, catalytic domain
MNNFTAYPTLYQINARTWVNQRARQSGGAATLADIPDAELDDLVSHGFDWVYLLGAWQRGENGRRMARSDANLRREALRHIPDLQEREICGSCFAITGYQISPDLGGDPALAVLRERLRQRGIRLMLDFIPNHTAIDHPWAWSQPGYYIQGTEADQRREPKNYVRVETAKGKLVLAHGRDPHFPGWNDTLQLNYANPMVIEAMTQELLSLAERCDGLRCDMAMLVLPEVFERTWGHRPAPFWPYSIQQLRQRHPDFILLAEVYWDLEYLLQEQGFNYTYDKHLYDLLLEGRAQPVIHRLRADLRYQSRMARFLENHDEERAAVKFSGGVNRAAAAVTYLAPGLRFFHQGQLEGRRFRVPMQLCRGPEETVDAEVFNDYRRLLACLAQPTLHQGEWQLLEADPAWDNNPTWSDFILYLWKYAETILLVTVNYSSHPSQCYVRLPYPWLQSQDWSLEDWLSPVVYVRDGNEITTQGLYLDLPAWGVHAFDLKPVK